MAFQTSSGSARERWIKALLPAAVILLVYLLLINLGRGRDIKELEKTRAEAEKNGTSQMAVATVRRELTEARRERDELEEQIEETESGIDASLASFTGASPAARAPEVDRLCRELSITLLNQMSTREVKISKVREQSLQTLKKLTPGEVSYRQLDVVGRYGDIVTLLKRLPQTIEGAVPLGIELLHEKRSDGQDRESDGQRMWRVYLLM